MKKAVHFGAGSIGRGFIGERLHASGYEVVFADVSDDIIEMINHNHAYELQLINHNLKSITIDHVSAISTIHETEKVIELLTECDLITTSVWPNNLPKVAPIIAVGLKQRLLKGNGPVEVMACENAIFASDILKEEVQKCLGKDSEAVMKSAAFVNTAIARMVIDDVVDGKKIVKIADDYEIAIAENELLNKDGKPLDGGLYTDHLQKYIERKLFIVNSAHCIGAYLGYQHGKTYIRECFEDERICQEVRSAMVEAATLISKKHGFAMEELQAFIDYTIRRYVTPGVYDDIIRVCRSPIRKVAKGDRLVLPIIECAKYGLENQALCKGLAAAYAYDYAEETEAMVIQRSIQTKGIYETVKDYSELNQDKALIQKVVHAYQALKEEQE